VKAPRRPPKRRKVSQRVEQLPAAESEKLHKVLADAGIGSRREMERWITAGRVSVNGNVATLGTRVTDVDKIIVDDKPLERARASVSRIVIMNKAEGVVCTRRDPEGRPTCFDGLPRLTDGRWVVVGRLDINSSGLLLLSNDGALVHHLMHPSGNLDREYAVRVSGLIDDDVQGVLREGVLLDDQIARFTDIARHGGSGQNHWYHVTLMEGRNREVRRLFESQGIRVSRLKRVRYGPVVLPGTLRRGHWQEMSPADVTMVYRIMRMPLPRLPAHASSRGVPSALIPYPALPPAARG
jgi:23S rRNA pseudouridine2605 synthase